MRSPVLIALLAVIVWVGCIGTAQAKDWKQQAAKNYRHACTHSKLVGGGHVIAPREERGWYSEACRLNRYVLRTWHFIRMPSPLRNAGDWIPLLRHEGWPESAIPTAVAIVRRESGGIPTAKNPHSTATGLFQILASYYPGENLYDPVVNVRVALRLYKARGWLPWRCY